MESSKTLAAPVLTAAQQKKSFSGSTKVQKRKVVLNILDSPLDLDWPRIGAEKEEQVKVLLTEHLSPVRANNVSLPKTTICAMPKEERAEWRKKEQEKARLAVVESKSKMSDMLVGFRDVVKAAGKGQCCVVFCEKTPDPPLLTRLLAPLCQNNGIPLIAIKNFSVAVRNLLRVPRCLTMALKLSAKETTSPLNIFYQKCMEIYQSCGLLKTVRRLAPSTVSSDATRQEEESDDVKKADSRREKFAVTGPIERFYLKRSDQACRFIPGVTKNPLKTGDHTDDTRSIAADFIALSTQPAPTSPPVQIYRQHKIKQIQPNENKKKRQKQSDKEPTPQKKKKI